MVKIDKLKIYLKKNTGIEAEGLPQSSLIIILGFFLILVALLIAC